MSSQEKLDLIIFGASGFTGEFIANEIANIYSDHLTFALAGRTKSKLEKVNATLSKPANKIIIADVKNESSLIEMCQQGKVLISAVGPYRFHGLQVMEACIKAKCDYVDISGEPWFIESAELKYNTLARNNGVYAVSACGFDSIPSDLGVEFTRQEFMKRYPCEQTDTEDGKTGLLNEVQAYLHGNTGGRGYTAHATTLECAVHGFSSVKDLISLRKANVKENPLISPVGKKGRHLKDFHSVPSSENRFGVKFPGSDRSIVLRSQQKISKISQENVVQYFMYVSVANTFMNKLKMYATGFVLGVLTNFSWGRSLIINYPKMMSFGSFSHQGPSKEQYQNAIFQIDFTGTGVLPEKTIKTTIVGPDPGYIGTASMVVASAVTLLKDREFLPQQGGVMTTAFAFRATNIWERLQKRGIKFSVVN